MRPQHISRKQMFDLTGTSSYRFSLSFPLFYSSVLPTHPLLYSRNTCSSSAQPSSRRAASIPAFPLAGTKNTALLPLRKWEELPKERAKQPNKWNYKYPGTHKSHAATAKLQAERKQHKSTDTDTHHKKLQCQINLCLTSNQHPVDFAQLGPDPERQLLIHLTQYPLLHRAPKRG